MYPLAIPMTPGRDLVPFEAPPVPAVGDAAGPPGTAAESPYREIVGDLDMGRLSPRQAAKMSMDLYVEGILGWEEYAMLAFQPELHPDYDRTIGALVGRAAEPDRPRDFIDIWEKRLLFERRYTPDDPRLIDRTEYILIVLRRIDNPAGLIV